MLKTSVICSGLDKPEEFLHRLQLIAEAGFDAIDLNLQEKAVRLIMDSDEAMAVADRVRAQVEASGIEIGQCHAPYNPYEFKHPEAGPRVIHYVKKSFPFAKRLGVKDVVVHPMRPRDSTDPLYKHPETFYEWNVSMYTEMVEMANEAGLTLCTENLFSVTEQRTAIHGFTSSAEDIISLMDAVPGLCVCFDIGHAKLVGLDPTDTVRAFGSRLKLLHLHNNDGVWDLHVSPFELSPIDWEKFGRALKEIGFTGNINLETDCFINPMPEPLQADAYRYLHSCAKYIASLVK